MNDTEKRILSEKLQLIEGRTRAEQLKASVDSIKVSQKAQADLLVSAKKDIDEILHILTSQADITKTDSTEPLSSPLNPVELPQFIPLSCVTDENRDIFLESNGIDISGDMLSQFFSADETRELLSVQDEIEKEFSSKTSIANKTDLSFLMIATALHVVKSLLFPSISEKLNYGNSFDSTERLPHDDDSIKTAQREANEKFKNKHIEKNGTGYWINILYQTPPYDTTVGSPAIGYNMEASYHRLHTLGHDPILGWIFGTANILTDIITLDNFDSYRIVRSPKIMITPEQVPLTAMFQESYEMMRADPLNLPAALFAQGQHFKSDAFTKRGLPVPVVEAFSPELAGKLYKEQYDALCFKRDAIIISKSAGISLLFNIIISLAHGLFYNSADEPSRELFEVRTRKILLISNIIASTSSVITTSITQNSKGLDIGGLLITLSRLFCDTRFILKIKKEFIESEFDNHLNQKLKDLGY